ncbi:hypothetical protein YT1_3993 [Rhodococcus ruber]|nr:hypothetical protein YT1_3993 [Rhodococcus ruber]
MPLTSSDSAILPLDPGNAERRPPRGMDAVRRQRELAHLMIA